MKNSAAHPRIFQFRKFSIGDDRCAMKVGTDAVLLGAWVSVAGAKRILDIGTGCGVIALMLAQRTNDDAIINAVEIEAADARQAKDNVLKSPWLKKVTVHQKAIQAFDIGERFDLIVSNPPYYVNSLLPPARARAQARHGKSLTAEELIDQSLRLLRPSGKLAVVLPFAEGNEFRQRAKAKGMFIRRQLAFYSRREKPQERWLFELALTGGRVEQEELILYETMLAKSQAYISLTKDFYL